MHVPHLTFCASGQGTVSILLVYDKAPLDGSKFNVYFSDVSKSVLGPTFTNIWRGTSDPATLQAFIDRMKANQFVVTTVQPSGSSSSVPVSVINVDLVGSGIIPPSDGGLQPTPPATTTPPPGIPLTMDMTAFGVRDLRSIPDSGEFKPLTSNAPRDRPFDPFIGTIFLAASLLLFWG